MLRVVVVVWALAAHAAADAPVADVLGFTGLAVPKQCNCGISYNHDELCTCGDCASGTESCDDVCPIAGLAPFGTHCAGGWLYSSLCGLQCAAQNDPDSLCGAGSGKRLCVSVFRVDDVVYFQCATRNDGVPECLNAADEDSMVCGDGDVDAATYEQCDDGNTVAGDGCNSACEIEDHYLCTFEPVCNGTFIASLSNCTELRDTDHGDTGAAVRVRATVRGLSLAALRADGALAALADAMADLLAIDNAVVVSGPIGLRGVCEGGLPTTIQSDNGTLVLEWAAMVSERDLTTLEAVSTAMGALSTAALGTAINQALTLSSVEIESIVVPDIIYPTDDTPPVVTMETRVVQSGSGRTECVATAGDTIQITITALDYDPLQSVEVNTFSIGTAWQHVAVQGNETHFWIDFPINSTMDISGALTFQVTATDYGGLQVQLDHTDAPCSNTSTQVVIDLDAPSPVVTMLSAVPDDNAVDRIFDVSVDCGADVVLVDTSKVEISCEGCEATFPALTTTLTTDATTITTTVEVRSLDKDGFLQVTCAAGCCVDHAALSNDDATFRELMDFVVTVDSSLLTTLSVVTAVLGATLVGCVLWYAWNMRGPVEVFASTHNFFGLMLLIGSVVILAIVPTTGLERSDVSRDMRTSACNASPQIIAHTAIPVMALLVGRSWLLQRDQGFEEGGGGQAGFRGTMSNLNQPERGEIVVLPRSLLNVVLLPVALSAGIMIAWGAQFGASTFLTRDAVDPSWACTYDGTPLLWIVLTIFLVSVVAGLLLVLRGNVMGGMVWRETKQTAFVFYNITLLVCIAVPVTLLIEDPSAWFVARAMACWLVVCSVSGVTMYRLQKGLAAVNGPKAMDDVPS